MAGWAGEIGKPIDEVQQLIDELRSMQIGDISLENDAQVTIISRRMMRDERARKLARKRKQKQRDDVESRSQSRACPISVTGIYQKSEVRSQISEEEKKKKEKKKKEKKNLSPDGGAPGGVSGATWDRYAEAYRTRYGVDPVRNAQTNALLVRLVKKLGEVEAPQVAAFYVRHEKALYVSNRHPCSLLVRDAEGLRTEWATGMTSPVHPPQAKCAWVNGGQCEAYAKDRSKYCGKHGEIVKQAQARRLGGASDIRAPADAVGVVALVTGERVK